MTSTSDVTVNGCLINRELYLTAEAEPLDDLLPDVPFTSSTPRRHMFPNAGSGEGQADDDLSVLKLTVSGSGSSAMWFNAMPNHRVLVMDLAISLATGSYKLL